MLLDKVSAELALFTELNIPKLNKENIHGGHLEVCLQDMYCRGYASSARHFFLHYTLSNSMRVAAVSAGDGVLCSKQW